MHRLIFKAFFTHFLKEDSSLMSRARLRISTVLFLMLVCSCAPVTTKQFIADGKQQLSQEELHELVSGNGFHLESIDFDAKIHFLPSGQLSCTDLHGTAEKGKWKITPEDQLCIKFDRWYFGDLNCYTLFKEKNNYVFFTNNGARYYTGKLLSGNGDAVAMQSKSKSNQTVPSENFTTSHRNNSESSISPRPSKEEKKHTLINLARNCPDCNLSGVDLMGAQLIVANLNGADLSGANLSGANLRRANLIGANLSGAKLVRANLTGADLSGSNLSNADLTGSNLIRAVVTDANLDGAILTDAHLESIKGMSN
jgi:uncharacterized protein YjbI with pentapeptide repeats